MGNRVSSSGRRTRGPFHSSLLSFGDWEYNLRKETCLWDSERHPPLLSWSFALHHLPSHLRNENFPVNCWLSLLAHPKLCLQEEKLAWVPYLKTNRLSCNRNRKVWWAAACSLTALTASSSWPLLTAANAVTAAPISKAADYSSWFKQFKVRSMSLVCDIQFQNEHSKEK